MNITGGIYNGRKITAPDEKYVRPTLSKIRMSVFNILFSILGNFDNKTFLDMFGGSGIMGLEAISRGFKKSIVFEKNKIVSEIIKSNYKALGLIPNLHIGDSLKLIKTLDESYDVIYIDPPYISDIYEDIKKEIKDWFKSNPELIVIFEHSKAIDFSGFNTIKQKKYGDKFITFVSK